MFIVFDESGAWETAVGAAVQAAMPRVWSEP
jgi:hypothetical protein